MFDELPQLETLQIKLLGFETKDGRGSHESTDKRKVFKKIRELSTNLILILVICRFALEVFNYLISQQRNATVENRSIFEKVNTIDLLCRLFNAYILRCYLCRSHNFF